MNLPRLRVSGAVVRRWLQPGIGFKRWLVVVFVGELLLALAGALLLRQVYREYEFSGPGQTALYLLTMQFVPYWVRGLIVATAGTVLFVYGSWRSVRVLMGPFLNRKAISRLWRSSTRSGSWPGAPRSWSSVAVRDCPPCCAVSRSTPATSRPWSPSRTMAAPRAGCAKSWASPRSATSATASPRWRTPSR